MTETRVRRIASSALALLAAAALAGCVAIPTGGPVTAGENPGSNDTPSSVLIPQEPERGADPQQILQGFIRAATGPQGDYAVARQFLTAEESALWRPDAGVTIGQAGTESYTQTGETALEYGIQPTAFVDEHGRYRSADTSAPQLLPFAFVQEDGEWRISDAPDGIVLTASAFDQIFETRPFYFFDVDYGALVPDLRWFPSATRAPRLVTSLLAGPSDWLAPAVASAFDEGAELGAGSVLVSDGLATVDLDGTARGANDVQLQRMRLQLEATLDGLEAVNEVALSIDQVTVPISSGAVEGIAVEPTVQPGTLLQRDGAFGLSVRGAMQPLEALGPQIVALGADSVTLSHSRSFAAVRAGGVAYLVQSGQEPRLIDDRAGLAPPSLDDRGHVWSVPSENPSAIRVTDLDGVGHDVASQLPAQGRVLALEVSREGARLAVLFESGAGAYLAVAAIVRENGLPVALGPPHYLPLANAEPIDASWVDSLRLVTIGFADGEYTGALHTVGGLTTSLGRLPFASQVVGGVGEEGIRVLGPGGVIYQPRGTGWRSSSVSAEFLGTQR